MKTDNEKRAEMSRVAFGNTNNDSVIMMTMDYIHKHLGCIRLGHARFDANYDSMGAFKDFIELVRPYIKSGSAWGWWESDASSFEVFY